MSPSTSNSHGLNVHLGEGEALGNLTRWYPKPRGTAGRCWAMPCTSSLCPSSQGLGGQSMCVCAPCPPSSLALLQSRRLTHLLNQRSSPRPLPRPPSFKDINILLLFIGRNMQMNVCGKALESSNVNKTSKQGLSSLRAMLTQYTSVVLQSITS